MKREMEGPGEEEEDEVPDSFSLKRKVRSGSYKFQSPSQKKSKSDEVRMSVGGHAVRFPLPPYPSQVVMMDRMLGALKRGEHALLESPTGTGKSLSLLCAALAWQEQEKALALKRVKELQQSNRSNLEEQLDEEDVLDAFPSVGRSREQKLQEAEEAARYPRIFVGSRTHSQISQLCRELERTSYRPVISVLASREHYCVHPRVSTSSHKSYECKRLNAKRDQSNCVYKRNKKALVHDASLMPGGQNEIWDIEDLVTLGSELKACPYFAARSIGKKADLIFCPYNHLIDPGVRGTYGIDLKGNVVILDEAHNIEDACRNAASFEATYAEIQGAATALATILQHITDDELREKHRMVWKLLHEWELWISANSATLDRNEFETSTRVWTGREKLALLSEMGLTADNYEKHHEAMEAVFRYSAEAKETQDKLNAKQVATIENIFKLWVFFFSHGGKFIDDYKLVLQQTSQRDRERQSSYWVQTLCVWCLNPAVAFTSLAEEARSVVLTSGTLAPIETLRTELGAKFPVHLEAKHVIDVKKQVWVGTIPRGRTNVPFNAVFKNADTFSFQDSIGEAVLECCKVIPHGVLCFFPSYGLLDRVVERWRATQLWDRLSSVKQIFIEPRQKGHSDFDTLIKQYYAAIKRGGITDPDVEESTTSPVTLRNCARSKSDRRRGDRTGTNGALFLAVYRGKVSEGIDFSDDNARGVIAIGIPYPNLKDPQMQLKREYNELHSRRRPIINGRKWYELQAWRAINQAIGRCIRHRHDYGAIIFLEERLQRSESVMMLPKWVVQGISHYQGLTESLDSLREFFSSPDRVTKTITKDVHTSMADSRYPTSSTQTQSPSIHGRKRPTVSVCKEEPPSPFLLKRSKSDSSVRVSSQYSSSPLSPLEPPSQEAKVKIEAEADNFSPPTLSPYFTSPVPLRPLRQVSSSPSLSPSQSSPAPRVSPIAVKKEEPSSQGPIICCNVCSSPLAHQRTSQVEMITKRYFCKLVSHCIRGTPHSQPWEVPVHTLSASDLIRSNCHALTEAEMAELKPNVPSAHFPKKNATPTEGRSVSTIWASTDGMLYVPLFCCRCKPPQWVGVVIKAADASNRALLQRVWLSAEAASPLLLT